MSKKKYYNFRNPIDMIALAKYVATQVYWKDTFLYKGEIIGYENFWDIVETEYDNGAIAVKIDYNCVLFTYSAY